MPKKKTDHVADGFDSFFTLTAKMREQVKKVSKSMADAHYAAIASAEKPLREAAEAAAQASADAQVRDLPSSGLELID